MAKTLPFIFLFITFTHLRLSGIAAETSNQISVGQVLTAKTNGSAWISPGGDFAFGFHSLNKRNDLFLLGIWYAKIPDTVVWHANEGNPVPKGSTVTIEANRGLVLSDPQGAHLWDTSDDLMGARVVGYGSMNDTGNFELKTTTGSVVWESFEHPTDTLLPRQSLGKGVVVNSRLSEANFTKGRFQLQFNNGDGKLVLNTRELVSGFAYGSYHDITDGNPADVDQKLVYDESGYMYVQISNGSRYDLLPQNKVAPSAKDYYQRATLNFDGVLSWYSIPKNSTENVWSRIQSVPDNICVFFARSNTPDIGSGICGFNSICSLGDDQSPVCKCPQGYSFLNPNDTFGSCKPDFKRDSCERFAHSDAYHAYQMVHLPDTDWPFNDYERLDPYTLEECTNSCLNDCFCDVVIFQTDGQFQGCWKKKGPLSNGRQDSTVQGSAWIKVGKFNYSDDPIITTLIHPTKTDKLKIVISVLLGASALVNLCLISTICWRNFMFSGKTPQPKVINESLRDYNNVHCFTFQELKDATNGFKEELGRGAFGIVYKGEINAGTSPPTPVAVKQLARISHEADKEFETEVNVIGGTHHRNLVQLIGFCKEEDRRLLVYEYMSNGSLADYLFGHVHPPWMSRVEIALGISKGLMYLHEECRTQIIHCDIKPQNILLEDHHNARISDFGLAKLLVLNQSQTITGIRGTRGYVAPEWFRNTPVTAKVDVYSFGALLLEIICCRKNVCAEISAEEKAILTDWAFDCYQSGDLDCLINDDMEALKDRQRFERFVMVALWCIQEDPSLRPSMRMVTQMLQGLTQVPSPPDCPSSFTVTIASDKSLII